jgi:hypothetical protein
VANGGSGLAAGAARSQRVPSSGIPRHQRQYPR